MGRRGGLGSMVQSSLVQTDGEAWGTVMSVYNYHGDGLGLFLVHSVMIDIHVDCGDAV